MFFFLPFVDLKLVFSFKFIRVRINLTSTDVCYMGLNLQGQKIFFLITWQFGDEDEGTVSQ